LPVDSGLAVSETATALTRDKKVEDGALWLVVVRSIGDVALRRTAFDELAALIQNDL
jgi:3-dehydroquinate synthetase